MSCERDRERVVLLLCGELDAPARAELEAHLAGCAECAAFRAAEERLLELLDEHRLDEETDRLLPACRRDLAAALAPASWRRAFVALLAGAPALRFAAPVAVIGILAGGFLLGRLTTAPVPTPASQHESAMVREIGVLADQPGQPRVRLAYDTLRQSALEGPARDPEIRRLLVGTMRDSLNAGLRLQAIDALRGQADDADVRAALLRTVGEDDNAGARLKALEALQPSAGRDPAVGCPAGAAAPRGGRSQRLRPPAGRDAGQRSGGGGGTSMSRTLGLFMLMLALAPALLLVCGTAPALAGEEGERFFRDGAFLVREIKGIVPDAGPGIRVETDLGVVSVEPSKSPELHYRVLVRARGRDETPRARLEGLRIGAARGPEGWRLTGRAVPGAKLDGLYAEFTLLVPQGRQSIEVATGAGDALLKGLTGRIELATRAGNILAEDLGGPLFARTRGGSISVGTLAGAGRLMTAGGSVTVASAGGDLVAQTSGGDVAVTRVAGNLRAETGGGNISVASAGGDVDVQTGGGAIVLGTVAGQVSAASAGGGIRVGGAGNGVRCETAAGPITLLGIGGPVRAVTSAGSIRADFLPAGGAFFDSDIQTWQGDVTVTLPESLPLTIRAVVENSLGRRIRSDFPLRIDRAAEDAGRPVEVAEGTVAGGGAVLRIRTLGGRIDILKAAGKP